MRTARRVLVTGASRGIGRAVAERMHRDGHMVLVTARDRADADGVAAGLGDPARGLQLDVTDGDSVAAAARAAGEVDVLVCNAGVLLDDGTPPSSVDLDLVRRSIETNVFGAWRVCQEFVTGMCARGWGRVVLLTSGAGIFANGLPARLPAYATSKVGVNALAALFAAEVGDTGVLVNAVNPGMVATAMMPRATRPVADAAADVVHVATLPDGGPNGRLFRSGRVVDW